MEAESVSKELETMFLTRSLEKKIIKVIRKKNSCLFAGKYREIFFCQRSVQYYFCKYLYFYIQDRCDRYYKSCIREEKLRNQYGNVREKGEREGREICTGGTCLSEASDKIKREMLTNRETICRWRKKGISGEYSTDTGRHL